MSKEIIQAEFDAGFGLHARLRHLKRALLWPTGKLSTGPWGGRFGADFWEPGKWRNPRPGIDVVGFTVNPVKVEADYAKLARQRPTAHVVAFVRSNVVKAVVSAVRGGVTHALCGADNLMAEEAARCKIPKELTIEVGSFLRMVYERLVLERRFVDLVYSLGKPVFEVVSFGGSLFGVVQGECARSHVLECPEAGWAITHGAGEKRSRETCVYCVGACARATRVPRKRKPKRAALF